MIPERILIILSSLTVIMAISLKSCGSMATTTILSE